MEENRRVPPPPPPFPPRPNIQAGQQPQPPVQQQFVQQPTQQPVQQISQQAPKEKPKKEPLSEQTKNVLFYCGGGLSFLLAIVCIILAIVL